MVRCALTVKDNNVCFTDGGGQLQTCTQYIDQNIDQCGYDKHMFRCCPETCRGKVGKHGIVMPTGNFTQKACRKLFDNKIPDIEENLGVCDYPFLSRIEDCSIIGTSFLHNIFDRQFILLQDKLSTDLISSFVF